MNAPVIALFGAAGKTGRAVSAALGRRGAEPSIRPLVRATSARPGERVVDLTDAASVRDAVVGADVLYVLAPNLHPNEPGIVRAAVAASLATGIRRVVYHSVLRPGVRAMPHHWHKLEAEELLWQSGLHVTVLQPSAYTQNLIACVDDGRIVVPYRTDVPFSLVDLMDVADVAARILTEPGAHDGAVYELAGPVRTVAEVAAALGMQTRRRPLPDPGEVGAPADDYSGRALRAMFDWYDQHGFAGCPRILEHLLERPPRLPEVVLRERLRI